MNKIILAALLLCAACADQTASINQPGVHSSDFIYDPKAKPIDSVAFVYDPAAPAVRASRFVVTDNQ